MIVSTPSFFRVTVPDTLSSEYSRPLTLVVAWAAPAARRIMATNTARMNWGAGFLSIFPPGNFMVTFHKRRACGEKYIRL
jgi:hypothetical protein